MSCKVSVAIFNFFYISLLLAGLVNLVFLFTSNFTAKYFTADEPL